MDLNRRQYWLIEFGEDFDCNSGRTLWAMLTTEPWVSNRAAALGSFEEVGFFLFRLGHQVLFKIVPANPAGMRVSLHVALQMNWFPPQ